MIANFYSSSNESIISIANSFDQNFGENFGGYMVPFCLLMSLMGVIRFGKVLIQSKISAGNYNLLDFLIYCCLESSEIE